MPTTTQLTDQAATGSMLAALGAYWLFFLLVSIIMLWAYWKIFVKAGKPGWAAIIPIYNVIVLLEIVGRPIWWIVLLLIPFVNIVVYAIVIMDLATSFGKGLGFAIGLILLPFIFLLILAFGSATYGARSQTMGAATPA
jgi:hypothetical protein